MFSYCIIRLSELFFLNYKSNWFCVCVCGCKNRSFLFKKWKICFGTTICFYHILFEFSRNKHLKEVLFLKQNWNLLWKKLDMFILRLLLNFFKMFPETIFLRKRQHFSISFFFKYKNHYMMLRFYTNKNTKCYECILMRKMNFNVDGKMSYFQVWFTYI